MKKISWLKRLTISFGTVAVATPLVLSMTSCSQANGLLSNFISYRTFLNDKTLNNMSKTYYSNDEMLLGSKKFCAGNYILFVGSNAYKNPDSTKNNSTLKFFTGSDDCKDRNVSNWFSHGDGGHLQDSIWFGDVQSSTSLHKIDRDFGFVTYLDDFKGSFYDANNHEYFVVNSDQTQLLKNIGPFDTWERSDVSLEQTRKYNNHPKWDPTYEFDRDENVKKTDYIRNDAGAIAFRSFMLRGSALFPTTDKRKKTFATDANNSAGLMIVYKDGRLQDILDLPTEQKINPKDDDTDKDTKTLFGTINKYYTPEEKKS